jgi:hypothetical protein
MTSIYLFTEEVGYPIIFAVRVVQTFMKLNQWKFLVIPVIGRISPFLPDGFEATGITLVVSSLNLTYTLSNLLDAYEIEYFKLDDGYYMRTTLPLLINFGFCAFFVLVCPLFLKNSDKGMPIKKLKRKKLMSKEGK